MSALSDAVMEILGRLDAKEITRKQAMDELVRLGLAPMVAFFLTSGRAA